jgi:hypothetical protein
VAIETRDVDDPGLDAAVDELIAAARKYREYVKRHHRDRLAGVMFVLCGHETVIYSESEKYGQQLLELTFSPTSDSFVRTCKHRWLTDASSGKEYCGLCGQLEDHLRKNDVAGTNEPHH